MKKFIAIMLSLSAGIVVLGLIILAIGGFRQIHSNFFNIGFIRTTEYTVSSNYSQPKQREKEADASQYRNIRLSLVNSQLDVIKTNDTKIKLTYDEYFDNEWNYSDSGDTIELKYYDESNWLNNILNWTRHPDNNKHTVKLYLPADTKVSLKMSSVNGDSAINDLSFESLDLDGVNGTYNLSDVNVQSGVDLENVNGGFELKNVTASSLDISSLVNGHCNLQNPQISSIDANSLVNSPMSITGLSSVADYRISYQVTNGGVNIDGDHYSGDGNTGSSSAKNRIDFEGVNSNLNITTRSSSGS